MIKFNSVFTKFFSHFNSNTKNLMLSAGATQKINFRFNKINLKNFYFQESKHGAGDVS